MGESLPVCIKYCLNKAKHDCFFVVGLEDGPKEIIGVIKSILTEVSEPLRAMLQDSELAEKQDVPIPIIDVEPKTFWNFLKCVYGASKIIIPDLNFEQSAELLYVVEKYLVNDIKYDLTEHMNNLFSTDSLFVALSHQVCFEDKRLKRKIEDILRNDFKNFTSNGQFLELSYSAIKWILQIEYLNVKEIEIWNAVVQWSKHKTGSKDGKVLRLEMIDLLKYIRFLTMNQSEFSEIVVSSKILDEEEIKDICCAFVLEKPCASKLLSSNIISRSTNDPTSEKIIRSFMEVPNQAYIRCSVRSVSNLQTDDNLISETHSWAGYFWDLLIKKESDNGVYSLGIYLNCEGETSDWKCSADVEVMLMNQSTKNDKRLSYSTIFCPSDRGWGFPSVITWLKLTNPDRGFVKDNCIIIHVKIQLKVT